MFVINRGKKIFQVKINNYIFSYMRFSISKNRMFGMEIMNCFMEGNIIENIIKYLSLNIF